MSGRLSNRPPVSPQTALNRLVAMSLVVWALLAAVSLAQHSRDATWGPSPPSATAARP